MEQITAKVWLRGCSGFLPFVFDSVAACRSWLQRVLADDMLLEFAGCGWHYRRYFDEEGSMWTKVRDSQ